MLCSIGLVIPSFNQGQFLAQALESIFSQRDVSLKVALCDAGSTDQTLPIAEEYRNRLAFFRSHPDRGQAAAVNEGIAQLKEASLVGWLNADDVLLQKGLQAMVQFLDEHSDYIAVFGKGHIIDEKGNIIGQYPTRRFQKKRFAIECTICQPASLIRRSAWERVGGLDESLQACMDYDLWWRLSEIGEIGYLKEFVASARDHPRTKSRTQQKVVHDEAISMLLRHWGMVPRNWCMANILRGLEKSRRDSSLGTLWEAFRRYVQINRWKAVLPQNWFF